MPVYKYENKTEHIRKGLIKGESYNTLAKTHHASKTTISKIYKSLTENEKMFRQINKQNLKNWVELKHSKLDENVKEKITKRDIYNIHREAYFFHYNKAITEKEQKEFEEFEDIKPYIGS